MALGSALFVLGTAPSRAAEPTPEFRESVRVLMELTGASQMGEQVANGAFRALVASLQHGKSALPQRAIDVIQEVATRTYGDFFGDTDRLLDEFTPLYARHFTRSEIDELIAFYRTPIGEKSIRVMPMIVEESMALGQVWAKEFEPIFLAEVRRRLTEEGLIAEDPPTAAP